VQGHKGRTLDEFLDLLDNVRRSGDNRYSARCPAHDDRQNSLSVAMGSKGILLRCFAGCDFTDVARAVGMAPTEFFEDELDARPLVLPAKPAAVPLPTEDELAYAHGRLMASLALMNRLYELKGWTKEAIAHFNIGFDGQRLWFPVRDACNELVNIVRYAPGGKLKPKSLALTGRPRDLFPGPELRGESVWLVEGEPDAISGYVLGLPAIGVPGVQGWKDSYVERLRGRQVTICFDCDDPGRGAAMKVQTSLEGAGVEVRRVDLDPHRQDGYDLTDYLVGGGSRERLMLL
jgi:putative DNA primase/helicase